MKAVFNSQQLQNLCIPERLHLFESFLCLLFSRYWVYFRKPSGWSMKLLIHFSLKTRLYKSTV